MAKYKINILGFEYKISFLEYPEYKAKWDDDTNGKTDLKDYTIDVMIRVWDDNTFNWFDTELVFWHEVGHAVEKGMPSSIRGSEWFAVCGEEFFKLHKELNKIWRQFRKDYEKREEKYLKTLKND